MDKYLLEFPLTLCDKHLQEHKDPFIVKFCNEWMYLAIPIKKHSSSCHLCIKNLEPSVYLRGANLEGANLEGANLVGARYSNYTTLPNLTDEQKKEMILV